MQCVNTFSGYNCTCGHGYISHVDRTGQEVGRGCWLACGGSIWCGAKSCKAHQCGMALGTCAAAPSGRGCFEVCRNRAPPSQLSTCLACRCAWTSMSACPSPSWTPSAPASAAPATTRAADTSECRAGGRPVSTSRGLCAGWACDCKCRACNSSMRSGLRSGYE